MTIDAQIASITTDIKICVDNPNVNMELNKIRNVPHFSNSVMGQGSVELSLVPNQHM